MDHNLSALMSVCGCTAAVVRMWTSIPQMMIVIYWPQWQKRRRSRAKFLETQVWNGIACGSCIIFLSPSLIHTLGLLFILSVGCAQGKEEGSRWWVGPPEHRCLGWHGSTGQSRDMKRNTHNYGHQLSLLRSPFLPQLISSSLSLSLFLFHHHVFLPPTLWSLVASGWLQGEVEHKLSSWSRLIKCISPVAVFLWN